MTRTYLAILLAVAFGSASYAGEIRSSAATTAATATALAANGANCSAGSAPLGVDASGAVESCFDVVTQAEQAISVTTPLYLTTTNCTDSAGDAACAAAPAGSVVVDATDTATVVSTTAVTANSQIFLQVDSSLGTRLSVTCNTQDPGTFDARVTARTAGTSFTITLDAGPTTNPLCVSYFIVN